MVSLLVVLFFSITGLTLNHQDWTFGQEPVTTTTTGTLPAASITAGAVNYLVISEYLRSQQGASGEITDHGVDGTVGRITYQGPGYTATATFDTITGSFTLASTRYGLVAVANDLHKGRHTSPAWSWLIDVVGGRAGFGRDHRAGAPTLHRPDAAARADPDRRGCRRRRCPGDAQLNQVGES